jgi:tRNA(Ile)-lysidine synthase
MFERFKHHIDQNFPFLMKGRSLIAISGGVDSVVLTHLCHRLQLNMALAHCNFNLRGVESDADELFVVQLAEANQLEVYVEGFETETYARDHKLSVQMAAREQRYHWLRELASQGDFDAILTAHHADDNLETFFINLFRGSGIEGLTGIPEINANVVRPMLIFSREDIKAYARAENLTWREDSTNASTKYLRNRLRLDLIPVLKEIHPQIIESLKQTQGHIKGSLDIVEDRMEDVSNRIIDKMSDGALYFNIAELLRFNDPRAYLYELLKDYGFTEWNDITDLLTAQSGKQVFSKTHRLLKDRAHLILTQRPLNDSQEIMVGMGVNRVETPLGDLLLEEVAERFDNSSNSILVDGSLLHYPLSVRPKREGDYFYPLGMRGKKKLSKYFKDEKLSLADKEKCLLLCSGEDIVWVLGRRADDRFKVTENTKKILKIELQ